MNQYIKVFFVCLAAFAIAIASGNFLMPQSAIVKAEYEAKYNELKSKSEITAADKKELDELFQQLNAKSNIKDDMIAIAVKYSLFLLLMIPLIIFVGRSINLSSTAIIASSGLIFLSFILAGLAVIGGLFATLFCISGISFRKLDDK